MLGIPGSPVLFFQLNGGGVDLGEKGGGRMDWEEEEGLYLGLEEKEKQGWLYYNSIYLKIIW